MGKKLVIVESPAKGKTIERYLGADYKVVASFGHVRDLPESKLGVDVDKNFEPTYVSSAKAKKVIAGLKREAKGAEAIYLATDLDREGEAIAWHITKALGLSDEGKRQKAKGKMFRRITFHEITKEVIQSAMKNPREINMNLVDAQQGRRVLDRLVGYKLSPFLWKKVYRGLSAGRVQSVTVRLIVEREREIDKFIPRQYWSIEGLFAKENGKEFQGLLEKIDGKSIKEFPSQKMTDDLIAEAKQGKYQIDNLIQDERQRGPAAPFTTSTLQQEANRKLRFSAKQTMMMAQRLYEGLDIGNGGQAGLITYMRTDSVNLAQSAISEARKVIQERFGEKYVPAQVRIFKTKTKGAQEAHEAIRPTLFARSPEQIEKYLDRNQLRLYKLIWERAIASQMIEAKLKDTVAEVGSQDLKQKFIFIARGSEIVFPGFLKVYEEGKDEVAQDQLVILPELEIKERVDLKDISGKEHFTQAPARYTEASLVKELEKKGIGRPSTYAPTMSTIVERGYVEKLQGKFQPQDVGMVVTDLLMEHFGDIVDYQFTAKMEEELDDIAEGKLKWQPVMKEFYEPFEQRLDEKMKEVDKKKVTEEKTDEKCPECKKPLVIKLGRFGKFYACTGYPECKYTKPYLDEMMTEKQEEEILNEEEKEKCPKCGAHLILRQGRFGTFFGCEKYPKCDFTKTMKVDSGVRCPDCKDGEIVMKRTRRGKTFWGCNKFPKCKKAFWNEPIDKKCPECHAIMTLGDNKVAKCSECDYEEVDMEKKTQE